MLNMILRWWLKRKIEYLQRISDTNVLTDADIGRAGKHPEYWLGHAAGIDTALKLLDLKDLDIEAYT
jgi:hypothetical protein